MVRSFLQVTMPTTMFYPSTGPFYRSRTTSLLSLEWPEYPHSAPFVAVQHTHARVVTEERHLKCAFTSLSCLSWQPIRLAFARVRATLVLCFPSCGSAGRDLLCWPCLTHTPSLLGMISPCVQCASASDLAVITLLASTPGLMPLTPST